MKILVVSIAPWDRNNNFGKTFCDIFEGMEDVEFLNIYCASGKPNNNVKAEYFQITLGDLIKSIIRPGAPVGRRVVADSSQFQEDKAEVVDQKNSKLISKIKAHRWRIFFWARRFVWLVGRWKSKELIKAIDDFDADLIFMPIFAEPYMNSVQQFVIKHCNKKCVAYYGDDNYSLRLFSLNPFFWTDRLVQRRAVKKTVDMCEYMYVVSDIEKEECERDFGKKCFICTKGAEFKKDNLPYVNYPQKKKLVYTGNLGNHRWEELKYIGEALDRIDEGHELIIYSGTPLTSNMKKQFDSVKSIKMMGRVSVDEIPEIQENADILVHVESFRLKERLLVHQSFSTKIVDYFSHAKCVFGVGAQDVAFADYLIRRDAAVVATSREEIEPKLRELLSNNDLMNEYAQKGYRLGEECHSIEAIQQRLRKDFKEYLGVE